VVVSGWVSIALYSLTKEVALSHKDSPITPLF
jgi:hypothetical protein